MSSGEDKSKVHFILVHSACMGAWCWYKLQTLLEEEGFDVIVPDLKASGVDKTSIENVRSFYDYSEPLFDVIEDIPDDEVAILVGNGTGGISIAMAAEKYFRKITALVFLGAFIPGTNEPPSSVLEEFVKRASHKRGFWKDTENPPKINEGRESTNLMVLGSDFLKFKLYNYSPNEIALLANRLVRPYPSSFFIPDLKEKRSENTLTTHNYGSVKRWVILSKNNGTHGPQAINEDFVEWQMARAGTIKTETLKELTDDMSMVSNPKQVMEILLKIATPHF